MYIVFPVWALTAWGLTVILVSQLLGGTFEARSCQSGCVWVLFWAAFVITAAGCGAGAWWLLKKENARAPLVFTSVGALFFLLVVFITTMAIGHFG